MSDLDLNAHQLTTDFAHNRQLDRVVRSVALERGVGYPAAHKSLMRWTADAPRGATVRAVLAGAGEQISLTAVQQDLTTLETAALVQAHAAAGATVDTPVDAQGRVYLAADANIGAMLHDPVVSENRFRAGRQYDPRYEHPETGRAAWDADERIMLDSHRDLLETLALPHRQAAAAEAPQQLARGLERAMRQGDGPVGRRKLLDSAIREHDSQMRLLDRAQPDVPRHHGTVMLDQDQGGPSAENIALAAELWRESERTGTPFMDLTNRHFAR